MPRLRADESGSRGPRTDRGSLVWLRRMVDEACSAGNVPPATRRALLAYGRGKLRGMHQIANTLGAADARQDLFTAVAALWLELRAEWERHNRVANHEAVYTGTPDVSVMAAAALCAGLLAKLETVIPEPARERFAALTIALLADVCDDASSGRVGIVDPSALAALSMR